MRTALDEEFGVSQARLLGELDRADLRRADRAHGADRDHRVADPDLDLHRAPVRVQVRGAGADRAVPRHPDHRGRVRPGRAGGDDVDGRGAAHHLGLLALRHDHRVRPNTRERAAHAAGDVHADRQPLDGRGARRGRSPRASATLLPVARADAVRRRDAAGLRVRAARRHRLGRLLVDLHRVAGADASGRSASPSTAAGARWSWRSTAASCRRSPPARSRPSRAAARRGAPRRRGARRRRRARGEPAAGARAQARRRRRHRRPRRRPHAAAGRAAAAADRPRAPSRAPQRRPSPPSRRRPPAPRRRRRRRRAATARRRRSPTAERSPGPRHAGSGSPKPSQSASDRARSTGGASG